uniref:Endo-1,4-beta-mannanase n=1 Tax=Sphingomonas sp. JB13 TaxID=1163478 RepID=I3PQX2_9SPHN|nr:endo-1,4-beta-mannanase precursor [Sphingomonas sp. JB13]
MIARRFSNLPESCGAIRSSFFCAIILLAGCGPLGRPNAASPPVAPAPIDRLATRETRALFASLRALAPAHTLFGHQDDLAYGYGWTGDPGRSDVKSVAGSYPAVYGWDVGDIFASGKGPLRYDPLRADKLRAWILSGYRRGGVITMSWHMPNPVAHSDAWDVATPAVARILPGGDHHAAFLADLDIAARFFRSLRAPDGSLVPVIFRPWHEQTGDWFWWGAAHCTADQFNALWRMTVARLRADGVHNLLYAYSTDVFDTPEDYLARYPGDDVVDILGFDDYHGIASRATLPQFEQRIRTVVTLAGSRGKIAAVTETGLEAIPDAIWWTDILGRGLDDVPGAAWVLVWRNANPANDRKEHFFAPYPGQKSAADFVQFTRDPRILLEDELPDLYARQR